MPVEPITHLEKSIAGTVEPVTHLEKVIDQYGGGGGGGVSSVNGKTGVVVLDAADVGAAPLQLTATPTAGPSGDELMSGTWSGATWEEVMAAVLASRLIQLDVAGIGPVTLLYNPGGNTTNVSSTAFAYNVGGTLYNVFAEADSNNQFKLSIINASTKTENIGGTTPTITPVANIIYKCGKLTSLTITNPPATGGYSIIFCSGATATVVTGIDNFTPEANKRYKITVEDNYATYDSWPYTPT